MFCAKCGSEIPEGSKVCPQCGTPVEQTSVSAPTNQTGKDIQSSVNDTLKNIQSNENVQKAQKSIASGWRAILAVLKDPSAKVSLGVGEMIVISVISVICFALLFVFGVKGAMVGLIGGLSSFVDVNYFMCVVSGLVITALILGIYILMHAIKDKGFKKTQDNLPGAIIGLILPSVFALASGLLFLVSLSLGAIALIMCMVCILVYIFKVLKNSNQYLLILVTTIAILVLSFAASQLVQNCVGAASLF